MTETNDKIKLNGEEARKALNYMELIVSSLMLKKWINAIQRWKKNSF